MVSLSFKRKKSIVARKTVDEVQVLEPSSTPSPFSGAQKINDDEWDVTIVGAGVAGASLAYALGKEGRKVLVIERFETTRSNRG
jgi:ribulose 1,5-bisphosphate synthetase/thiazole synthase